jgi:hypothetical protein
MAYSKATLQSSGDRASPCFRPFWIEQLLKIKDLNLQTVNQCSYSIINKYSVEEFKIRLSCESWDSIFSNNDNMCVDSLLNIFLNNYLRIVYTSFLLIKVIERSKSRQ